MKDIWKLFHALNISVCRHVYREGNTSAGYLEKEKKINILDSSVSDGQIFLKLLLMMHFSTGTGLERVGIAGPELELSLGRSAGSGR